MKKLLTLVCWMVVVGIASAAGIEEVVSIKDMDFFEYNSDSDPEYDAFKISAYLGDKYGNEVQLKDMEFGYECDIYDYTDKRQGAKLASDSGDTKTPDYFGRPWIICNVPNMSVKTRLLVHVKLRLPNGKVLEAKGSAWLDPEGY